MQIAYIIIGWCFMFNMCLVEKQIDDDKIKPLAFIIAAFIMLFFWPLVQLYIFKLKLDKKARYHYER